LFSQCRLIGRRFRLAHVRVRREVIEVATFRAAHQIDTYANDDQEQSDEGLLLRDNCYGTLLEDAWRRDFTINALYIDPVSFKVFDPTNGLNDIEQKTIRIIGKPLVRFREDPVRILRAVRFAGKLSFRIESATEQAIPQCAQLLELIPKARLFDEFYKLFMTGHGVKSFHQLEKYHLLKFLAPTTLPFLNQSWFRTFVTQSLENTDARIAAEKPVTPAFLLAVMLWAAVKKKFQEIEAQGRISTHEALFEAADFALDAQAQATVIPKRYSTMVREIWSLQPRLARLQFRRCESLLEHKRFRAAYDFLLLREDCGDLKPGLGAWWTEYQIANEERRREMVRLGI
ncbi:MAG: polynucleotide adenylyltransferase PcnB, partial [Pseudomonadota bacterium]